MSEICFFPTQDADLYVTEFGFSAPQKPRAVGPWVRSTYILHYVADGVCRFDGFDVHAGEAFLIAKDSLHHFTVSPPYRHFWLAFDGSSAERLLAAFSIPLRQHIRRRRKSCWGQRFAPAWRTAERMRWQRAHCFLCCRSSLRRRRFPRLRCRRRHGSSSVTIRARSQWNRSPQRCTGAKNICASSSNGSSAFRRSGIWCRSVCSARQRFWRKRSCAFRRLPFRWATPQRWRFLRRSKPTPASAPANTARPLRRDEMEFSHLPQQFYCRFIL